MPTIARRPAAQQEREWLQARRLRAADNGFIGELWTLDRGRGPVVQPQDRRAGQPHRSDPGEVIGQAWHGIERVRGTPHLAYAFLRRTGLSVA